MICTCPASAALATIPKFECSESFGQIQKIAFSRLRNSDGTLNSFSGGSPAIYKSSWTAKMAAEDATKIVISPYVEAPSSEPADARTFGGGNDTLNGIEEILGPNSTPFSAVIRRAPQEVIRAMKALQCEAAAGNLGVYLFNEHGQIEGIEKEENRLMPIPIRALFISDKGHGGFDAPDYNNISWQFEPNYSDYLKVVTPSDFNPLTDL